MMKFFKYLIYFFVIIFLFFTLNYFKKIDTPASDDSGETNLVVSRGEGVKKIGNNLFSKKLINSKFYFEFYIWQKGLESDFKAGTYNLRKDLNIKEIVEVLVGGETIDEEREIKIIEGWTIFDIANYFENEGMFQREELMELVGFPRVDYRKDKEVKKLENFYEKFDFLDDKPWFYSYEGYLFPDTYEIYKDASLEDIVLKMFSNLGRKLTPKMREDIKKQEKSIFEIITMASIIQKEVRSEKDMRMVSGIFWNRLGDNHPLQSCASLAYILGINKKVYSIEDTKISSPYNTYQNIGLPPGPISNPGLKAIEAAIYPTKTDYYFFLSKSKNGETVFSRTLQEHNLNKAKYIK